MCAFGASAGERWETSKQWSLDDGSRTIEENLAISVLPKAKKKFNVSNHPIFTTIPLTSRVVIDNLHLFLCVSDVLIDLLVEDAMRLDSLKMSKLSRLDSGKVCAYNSILTCIPVVAYTIHTTAPKHCSL